MARRGLESNVAKSEEDCNSPDAIVINHGIASPWDQGCDSSRSRNRSCLQAEIHAGKIFGNGFQSITCRTARALVAWLVELELAIHNTVLAKLCYNLLDMEPGLILVEIDCDRSCGSIVACRLGIEFSRKSKMD